MRDAILESSQMPLQEQLDYIRKNVEDWQDSEEQVDDIALMIVGIV